MSELNRARLTRRDFLRTTAGAAGALALAGCTVPTATMAPGAAPVTTDVYAMTFAAFADMGQRDATALYNDQIRDSGYRYVLEEVVEGAWEPKAVSMVRDGDMRWSACGIANAGLQWNYIQMGLVQPIDELLTTSTHPWVSTLRDRYYYANIYDATQYEGKTYFIPMKLNIHLMGYRQDYLEKAGYDGIPETWAEFEVMLGKLKDALADEDVVPFAARKEVFRTLGTAFTTFVENPYDENNMLKISSPEWLECIAMFKRWFDAGYTNLQVLQDPVADWQKGKVAIGIDSHSWIRIGRAIWGSQNIKGTIPPKVDASNPSRTWIHLDSGFVFAGAPHPQQGLDWLLAVLGPEGAPANRYWSGTLTFSGMPVHTEQYERLIGNTTTHPELQIAYAAIPTSVLQPLEAGRYYPIIQSKIWPWLERYWGGEISGEAAMQNVIDEVDAEIEKLIS